jgi:hypothetical protein
MNNNARFFFSFFGFFGFFFFFLVSCIVGDELLISLFKGSLGCLIFAIVGRSLLCFAMNGQSSKNLKSVRSGKASSKNSNNPNSYIDPSVSTTEAMTQAATKARRLVEAKA